MCRFARHLVGSRRVLPFLSPSYRSNRLLDEEFRHSPGIFTAWTLQSSGEPKV
jgi:hypothetical protein